MKSAAGEPCSPGQAKACPTKTACFSIAPKWPKSSWRTEVCRRRTKVKSGLWFTQHAATAGVFAESLKRLGLQLVAATAPVKYLVVDHVEQPSEN
jgi:uncharacterized protein (TIGR03435 family)